MRARFVVSTSLVAAIGGGVFVAALAAGGVSGAERFNRAVWARSVDSCSPSPRGAMVNDVLAHRLRDGMAMRDVRAVLGEPDEIAPDGTWVYDVDFEGDGLLGTCVTLQLYPKGARLQRAQIMRDS